MGRVGGGCALGFVTLLVGIAIGVGVTLNLLGLGVEALLRQPPSANGTAVVGAPPTATPPPVPIQGQAAPGRRMVWAAPIPLDTDTQEPDLLVISRNFDNDPSTDSVVYLSPNQRMVRWESPPLGQNGPSWVVTYGADVVLVADGERLVALSRATGQQLWVAPLTDSIADSICMNCLQVFGEVVVALPQDGQLQAFNTATGAPIWTKRLLEATRQIVKVGALLGVLDRESAETSRGALFLFKPQDGSAAGTVKPTCTQAGDFFETNINYYNRTEHDPAGRTLVWLAGSSAVCLLRYDVGSGTLSTMKLDELDNRHVTLEQSLWAGDTLYLSNGNQLVAVGPQTHRQVLASEDYDLRPLAANETVLLVLAHRTRGSSRYEVWVVDVQTGEKRWERILKADDPLDSPHDTGDFAATLLGETVLLVEQHAETKELIYEQIALADGASRVRTVVPVSDPTDALRGVLWGQKHVFLSSNELYAVTLADGQTVYHWP